MEIPFKRQISNTILTFACCTIAFMALFAAAAAAHSPILLIENNEDGTIMITAGFSNGTMAAGKQIQLLSQASGEVLWEGTLDQNSELTCPKQTEPYNVFFDGGPGHSIKKAGPLPTEGEAVPTQVKHSVEAEHDAMTAATVTGKPVHAPEQFMPLSSNFDDQVQALLPSEPLVLRNTDGVLQSTTIMQGYQYHNQSEMQAILTRLQEKQAAGKQVELAINPVELCFGVTSGYLALEYALHELYGDEIPVDDDFTISTKTMMGGIWDTWDLCFGKRLSREDAELGLTPKGFVFTAKRRSNGHQIVFAYSQAFAEDIRHLGSAKQHPEQFPEGESQHVKKSLITALLTQHAQKDFGYFQLVEKNY